MRTVIMLVMASALSGCVSYNTMLVNKDGKTTQCAGWAFGWATPIEMAMHHDCMEKAKAAGYHVPGEPQPQAATAAAQ